MFARVFSRRSAVWPPTVLRGTFAGCLLDEEKSERATAMIADLSYAVWKYSPGTQRRCQEFAYS